MNLTDFAMRAMEENGAMNYLHAKYLSLISYEGRKANSKFFAPAALLFSNDELDDDTFLIANDLVVMYLLSFGFDNTLFALQAENSEHGFESFEVDKTPPELQLGDTDSPILDMISWHMNRPPKQNHSKSPPLRQQNPPKKEEKASEPQQTTSNQSKPKPKIVINTQRPLNENEEDSDSPFNTEFGPPPITKTGDSGFDSFDLDGAIQKPIPSPQPQQPQRQTVTFIPNTKPKPLVPQSPRSYSSLDSDIGDD